MLVYSGPLLKRSPPLGCRDYIVEGFRCFGQRLVRRSLRLG